MKFEYATPHDIPEICVLCFEFIDEANIRYNGPNVVNLVSSYVGNSNCFVGVARSAGIIAGVFLAFSDYNVFNGDKCAQDRLVYVRPEFRNKQVVNGLYKQFQNWAREIGCREIFLSCLCSKDNEGLKNVMEWLGCTTHGYLVRKTL